MSFPFSGKKSRFRGAYTLAILKITNENVTNENVLKRSTKTIFETSVKRYQKPKNCIHYPSPIVI